jgi:hypothetical protein
MLALELYKTAYKFAVGIRHSLGYILGWMVIFHPLQSQLLNRSTSHVQMERGVIIADTKMDFGKFLYLFADSLTYRTQASTRQVTNSSLLASFCT